MAQTSKARIREWLEAGRSLGATHMFVLSDTFDYEYYPVYVSGSENVFMKADEHRTDLSKMRELMEVYSYALPLDPQVDERRSFRYEVAEDVNGFPGQTEPVALQLQATWEATALLTRLLAEPKPERIHWRQAVDQTVARLRSLLPEPCPQS